MLQPDNTNTLFQLAADFVNNTSRNIFLTGKAGTGKTTFLKYIKENSKKNTAVIAPTGVAAINAGGTTMHSFFQLPFGPFIPAIVGFSNNGATDKHSLFRNIRFSGSKRELFEELELLIIDEVSMLRCDMLDAMDTILRHFRRQQHVPFGGVQVLFIGDMFQLPPVVPQDEWDILEPYYKSPFFFDAKVIEEAPPLYIELKKIYRQNEQHFIDLLNKVRNNNVTQTDLSVLNDLYKPDFSPSQKEKFITLSTHNKKADAINAAELEKLPQQKFLFHGEIKGDFIDKALPTDKTLQLKEGSQVMFIKNDSGNERKYYNGKLATIKKIIDDKITVVFDDNSEMELEKETWKNISYTYHKESDTIDEEELGSFTQYPIRLAWAITIHKSQGLTFTKAIIDAGSSFAAGQVYVALSRCTTLDGVVLLSKIYPHSISTDERIIAFAKKENNSDELEKLLKAERLNYQSAALQKLFDWNKIIRVIKDLAELIPGKKLPDTTAAIELSQTLLSKSMAQKEIAQKFLSQLNALLQQLNANHDTTLLQERLGKAIAHFSKEIINDLLLPLRNHLDSLQHASKVRGYLQEVLKTESFIWQQLQKLQQVKFGDLVFDGVETIAAFAFSQKAINSKKEKPAKGSSQKESLQLYNSGNTVKEIALMRNLSQSTIEGHLIEFIKTGDIRIAELLPERKIEPIIKIINENPGASSSAIKLRLEEDYSYSDIRAVMNHLQWLKNNK